MEKKLSEKQRWLDNIYKNSDSGNFIAEIKKLEKEIEMLLNREEDNWIQRSRVGWLPSEDRNIKFFHNRASNRKRKNQLSKLRDIAGVWHSEPNEIIEVLQDYFHKYLSKRPTF
ncbi:hypothetical protein PanWU01x14_010620 [Parasponia andersonii]|uniref:Uncharacterized protein n=1 Tax=Parasponia andersonii TaxID=3476 RepID=A0A2P5E2T3_PARAD|nr:hypothetical protein PanWU01x14_010620 [Parasponia andersonii]